MKERWIACGVAVSCAAFIVACGDDRDVVNACGTYMFGGEMDVSSASIESDGGTGNTTIIDQIPESISDIVFAVPPASFCFVNVDTISAGDSATWFYTSRSGKEETIFWAFPEGPDTTSAEASVTIAYPYGGKYSGKVIVTFKDGSKGVEIECANVANVIGEPAPEESSSSADSTMSSSSEVESSESSEGLTKSSSSEDAGASSSSEESAASSSGEGGSSASGDESSSSEGSSSSVEADESLSSSEEATSSDASSSSSEKPAESSSSAKPAESSSSKEPEVSSSSEEPVQSSSSSEEPAQSSSSEKTEESSSSEIAPSSSSEAVSSSSEKVSSSSVAESSSSEESSSSVEEFSSSEAESSSSEEQQDDSSSSEEQQGGSSQSSGGEETIANAVEGTVLEGGKSYTIETCRNYTSSTAFQVRAEGFENCLAGLGSGSPTYWDNTATLCRGEVTTTLPFVINVPAGATVTVTSCH